MSGRDPNDDVQELKNELRRHETRIEELVQQLQQDRYCSTKKFKELEDKKKALENEVNELKKKIKLLDDEVRYFSTKPAITDLKKELKEKDARMDSMEKNFELKLNAVINRMEEKDKEIDKIGKELGKFVKKSQDKEKDLKTNKAETDKLEKSRNILYIGQLCANVMEETYREVLPDYFERDDYKQPHLNRIDEEIEHRYGKKSEQKEAKKSWRKFLQGKKIDADENMVMKLVDFMEKKLEERNVEAHPSPLNEEELEGIASNLPGQEQQYFEKLIQIYFHSTK